MVSMLAAVVAMCIVYRVNLRCRDSKIVRWVAVAGFIVLQTNVMLGRVLGFNILDFAWICLKISI